MKISTNKIIADDSIEMKAIECLIDLFAFHMKIKLRKKRIEGYVGWDKPDKISVENLIEKLKNNLEQGDMVDVAALAALIWNREDKLKPEIDCHQDIMRNKVILEIPRHKIITFYYLPDGSVNAGISLTSEEAESIRNYLPNG